MERPGATTLKGNPFTLIGPELKAGDPAPDFSLVDNGLKTVTLKEMCIRDRFNGYRRAETIDGIHVGPFHLVQKLARVGGQGLHVASLPLGINRVEGERRLSRAAQSRNHGQSVPRNFHIDIFQVVLARAMHRDSVQHSEM